MWGGSIQRFAPLVRFSSLKRNTDLLTSGPEKARQMARDIIKNTYRTLMTRGMKGCYVYCVDKELGEYLKGVLKINPTGID
jgi:uncharacterized protein